SPYRQQRPPRPYQPQPQPPHHRIPQKKRKNRRKKTQPNPKNGKKTNPLPGPRNAKATRDAAITRPMTTRKPMTGHAKARRGTDDEGMLMPVPLPRRQPSAAARPSRSARDAVPTSTPRR